MGCDRVRGTGGHGEGAKRPPHVDPVTAVHSGNIRG